MECTIGSAARSSLRIHTPIQSVGCTWPGDSLLQSYLLVQNQKCKCCNSFKTYLIHISCALHGC